MTKKSPEALGKGYQTPECEVISLIYDSAVIMYSSGKTDISDWVEDDEDDYIDFK